jgi:CxxC motif-containing protein (DUF1111 family)
VSIGPNPRSFFRKGGGLFPVAAYVSLAVSAFVLAAAAPAAGRKSAAPPPDRAAILKPTTDFSKPEKWENLPGGTATNRIRFDADAFSQPSASLSFEERAKFSIGNGLFRRTWVTAPSSTQSADGLGPLFNARGCQDCHLKDGRGHPPAHGDDNAVSMFLRLSVPAISAEDKQKIAEGARVIPEPTYGGQLQDIAIPGMAREGRMVIDYADVPVTLAGGEVVTLRKPIYSVADLGYGAMRTDVLLSPRVASPMIGLGLLEAISDEDILAHADPDDEDGDGISGRVNRVFSKIAGGFTVGRFGWKAGQARIAEQSADAAAGDIGLSNPRAPFAWGDCTPAQKICRDAPDGNNEDGFEVPAEVMDLIVFYSQNLAVPMRRSVGDATVLRGKELFYNSGCIACHTPKFATRKDYEVAALGGELIFPYSDLLLHDMGDGLADGRPEADASGSEWRTPPLWGLGYTKTVNGHTFLLHDGRARDAVEAILWHGGEAQKSRAAFVQMTKADRDALIAFLDSL